MDNRQSQLTGDDDFEAFAPSCSIEEALRRRWQRLATSPTTYQIFELLKQHDKMYQAEIARTLEITDSRVHQATHHLRWTKIIAVERHGQRTYYKLRPGMVEQYEQWLAAPLSKKSLHLRLFELLSERGEMDYLQITYTLGISFNKLNEVVALLHTMGFIDAKYQKVNQAKLYCRIQPGMVEQYWQWLASQQFDKSEP